MRILPFALIPVLVAPLLAQLPAPTLAPRTAPRAAWSAVTSAGTTTSGPLSGGAYTPTPNTTFRADTCGAASADRIWVFGGSLGNNTATTTNDLWAFDAVAGTFTQLLPDASPGAPPARGNHCVAWNPLTSKLVVFGGNSKGATPTLLSDTWEYDPTTNAWTQVLPATSPAPRQFASMAFDPNTGGMLLFGGQTSLPPTTTPPTPPTISGETWVLAGGNWTLMSPPMSPPARSQHSLCTRADSFFDVLLCCGLDNSTVNGTGTALEQNRFLDVWTWNGGTWTVLSDCDVVANPTGIGTTWPASVLGNQAVYDALRRRVVVQGGNGITIASNTTWIYGPNYGGSPSNYTSEFDCLTNSWEIYANPTTGATPFNNNDPVIGRISRYFGGFVPATGKVYKICGQTPASTGSRPLYNVYEYQANPVAASVINGAGCAATAGVMNLTGANAPWTGRQFQTSCSGFSATSLGFGVLGFTPQSVPLAALHPAGLVGCNLLATADSTSLLLPSGGSVGFGFVVPAGVAFAGLPLELQVLQVEVNLTFAITSIVGSNSLSLTIGAL